MPLATAALLMAASAPSPLPAPAGVASSPLILDQGRADRVPPAAAAPPARPVPRAVTRIDEAGDGQPIRGIRFEGTRVPAVVGRAAARFVGQPASRATLEALARAMTDAYGRSDVALYTIRIPAQRPGGTVRVLVAEGFVEAVTFARDPGPLVRALADRLTRERPLTRRTLERVLSLIRDIPGGRLDLTLRQGRQPGGVVAVIDAGRKRRDLAVAFDNRGAALLGDGQLRGEAHLFSLVRDGDRTDLTALASPDFHRLRYLSAQHATPIGHDGLTLALSAGYLRTRPKRTVVDGDARTAGLSVAYPLLRGYRRNFTLSVGVDGLDSDAAAFGTLLSSDRTRALRLAAGYSDARPTSVVTLGATLSRGLDMLGARGRTGYTDTVFTKLNLRASYDRQVGRRLFARGRIAGQVGPDRFAAAERFAIGGAEFGRGFDLATLSGDQGVAALAELAVRPKLPKLLDGSEVYAFVDGGRVRIRPRGVQIGDDYDLASAGAGVRLVVGPRAALDLEAARVIDRPYAGWRGAGWRINVGWRISAARRCAAPLRPAEMAAGRDARFAPAAALSYRHRTRPPEEPA